MPEQVRLGLSLDYWGRLPPGDLAPLVAEAEALGYDSLWTAEAYGSDALTPLAWWGSRTSILRLGTAAAQMHARPPTAMAMAAATLDHLCGGRFVLGLGVSGPQVVEGWYGSEFSPPVSFTREYVAVVRQALRREAPLTFQGRHLNLPRPGGRGRALRLTVDPLRHDLPIWLAAEGPRNIALAGELADGWHAGFHAPARSGWQQQALAAGLSRRGRDRAGFEVSASLPIVMDDDLERAADRLRPTLALYIGGMGSRQSNFHFNLFCRLGFETEARAIQDLYLAGERQAAAAAVPLALVDEVALVGPLGRLRERAEAWKQGLPDLLLVAGPVPRLRLAAELFL